MNKKTRISLIVLLTVILLMALTVPVWAKNRPYLMRIEYTFEDVDWENKSAEGTFSIVEPESAARDGTATLEWIRRTQMKRGKMFLYDTGGTGGILAIRFSIPSKPADGDCGTGSFVVLPDESTGFDFFGTGTIEICRELGSQGEYDLYGQLWGTPFLD